MSANIDPTRFDPPPEPQSEGWVWCEACGDSVPVEHAHHNSIHGLYVCSPCFDDLVRPKAWDAPKIKGDSRIDDGDRRVRLVAERLHSMESMHLHEHIGDKVCAYCALRASHAVRLLDGMAQDGRASAAVQS